MRLRQRTTNPPEVFRLAPTLNVCDLGRKVTGRETGPSRFCASASFSCDSGRNSTALPAPLVATAVARLGPAFRIAESKGDWYDDLKTGTTSCTAPQTTAVRDRNRRRVD